MITEKEWFENNTLGFDIWKNKYQHNNESLDEWFDRISAGDAEAREIMVKKKFMPAGRILSNRGLNKDGIKNTYSNCFVISPPEDNIESIFECAKKMARTFSYGGGVGVDISKLSPSGARINNAAKETTGAVSFMELYSLVTGLISQKGRRGALMISLDCTHPDLAEFASIKTDLDKVTKANISIKITDDFMRAVKNNEDWELSFTREETGETVSKIINAKEFFIKLCEYNWDYAEPGLLFWDKINNWNLLSNNNEFEYAGVNPCAEEPLPAGGSCLLGSINLSAFVKNPFTHQATFDLNEFRKTVKIAVRFLNCILDEGIDLLPLEEQKESAREWRQIGLGIMGLGDAFIKMGHVYGDTNSYYLSHAIGYAMINSALQASSELAKENGCYSQFTDDVLNTDFFKEVADEDTVRMVEEYGLYNSQLLTSAPTGSISNLIGISSGGIEPLFATHYTRKTLSLHNEEKTYTVYSPIVREYINAKKLKPDSDGNYALPRCFVTAMDGINIRRRIGMQGVWQTYIDASISSTINLPNNATVQDVYDAYVYAWDRGLKGITIYRDGCARGGILSIESEKVDDKVINKKNKAKVIEVDDAAIGRKRKLVTGCGSLHCVAFFDKKTGELVETYLSKGSTGGCNNFMVGLSRMISLSARGGIGIETIVDQLNSTGACPSYAVRSAKYKDTSKGACCPMAVGNALMDMYKEVQEEINHKCKCETNSNHKKNTTSVNLPNVANKSKCPECDGELVFTNGCNFCMDCGWTKCD